MNSIEEVINSKALEEMQSRLKSKIDPRSWTKETRDAEITEIVQVTKEVVVESVDLTFKMLNQVVDNKSYLFWHLQAQVLGSLIEYLVQARNDYDWLSIEEQKALALDTEWLTSKIQEVIVMYKEAQDKVTQVLQDVANSAMIDTQEL